MNPMEWLRRQKKPMTPEQQTRFLQVCEAVDTSIRNARLAPAQLAPPREIPWTNPVRTVGSCPHDVIYSSCNCADTNIRTQTSAADFRAELR